MRVFRPLAGLKDGTLDGGEVLPGAGVRCSSEAA
jgi:hypothetical protein